MRDLHYLDLYHIIVLKLMKMSVNTNVFLALKLEKEAV